MRPMPCLVWPYVYAFVRIRAACTWIRTAKAFFFSFKFVSILFPYPISDRYNIQRIACARVCVWQKSFTAKPNGFTCTPHLFEGKKPRCIPTPWGFTRTADAFCRFRVRLNLPAVDLSFFSFVSPRSLFALPSYLSSVERVFSRVLCRWPTSVCGGGSQLGRWMDRPLPSEIFAPCIYIIRSGNGRFICIITNRLMIPVANSYRFSFCILLSWLYS